MPAASVQIILNSGAQYSLSMRRYSGMLLLWDAQTLGDTVPHKVSDLLWEKGTPMLSATKLQKVNSPLVSWGSVQVPTASLKSSPKLR